MKYGESLVLGGAGGGYLFEFGANGSSKFIVISCVFFLLPKINASVVISAIVLHTRKGNFQLIGDLHLYRAFLGHKHFLLQLVDPFEVHVQDLFLGDEVLEDIGVKFQVLDEILMDETTDSGGLHAAELFVQSKGRLLRADVFVYFLLVLQVQIYHFSSLVVYFR